MIDAKKNSDLMEGGGSVDTYRQELRPAGSCYRTERNKERAMVGILESS